MFESCRDRHRFLNRHTVRFELFAGPEAEAKDMTAAPNLPTPDPQNLFQHAQSVPLPPQV
jgi:hypothetical protein